MDSLLLSYYQAQLNDTPSAIAAANAVSTATSASPATAPPPMTIRPGTSRITQAMRKQAKILSTTNFLNTTNVPLSAGATSDAKLEQDNQKLFSLYNAVNSLS